MRIHRRSHRRRRSVIGLACLISLGSATGWIVATPARAANRYECLAWASPYMPVWDQFAQTTVLRPVRTCVSRRCKLPYNFHYGSSGKCFTREEVDRKVAKEGGPPVDQSSKYKDSDW